MNKRAVVLAGGTGSRMGELCRIINKHLLPVGQQPMLIWPIEFLIKNGFTDIMIVLGRKGCGEIMRQLGDGSRFGARFAFTFQETEGGIAEALKLAEPWVEHEFAFPVILGDNIFPDTLDLRSEFRTFAAAAHARGLVFCTYHKNPELFGCAILVPEENLVYQVIEKPQNLRPNINVGIVTGLYVYSPHVFKVIKELRPSKRGELEISTVNDFYAQGKRLHCKIFPEGWLDCGVPDLYREANAWAEQKLLAKVG